MAKTMFSVDVRPACSYGSKPGWFWASFWLFLTAEIKLGPKNIFS
jgi:hypothetical protein